MIRLTFILALLVTVNCVAASLESTFAVPDGYQRVAAETHSYASYLRNLQVLPDSARVLNFKGDPVSFWPDDVRVLDIAFLFPEDLEQCADMGLRLYSEHMWSQGRADELTFPLQNGQRISWAEWKQGRRLQLNETGTRHIHKVVAADDSRNSFNEFLRYLFYWTGSAGMKSGLKKVDESELRPGDMIIQNEGGGMGHLSIILDMAQNTSGEKLYLIGNGWTPAQSFFIHKATAGNGDDYWFTIDGYRRHLSRFSFGPFNFRRF